MNEEPLDPRLIDASANREGRERIITHPATSLAAQWTGFFLAPATFFAHLQVAFVLVPWSCARGNHLWLHVAGALSVLLAIVGTVVAWTTWAREGGGEPGQDGGPSPRARFLAVTGFVMSAMFVLLLAAQWAAAFIISPCQ
jgi:hypothetical protein